MDWPRLHADRSTHPFSIVEGDKEGDGIYCHIGARVISSGMFVEQGRIPLLWDARRKIRA